VISTRHPRPGARRVGSALACCVAALLLVVAPATAKTVQGGPAPETLVGTAKADQIFGRGAGDSLFGRAGNDRLIGGPGDDSINGGTGRDTILGGPGDDRILADDGYPDKINCGPGWDVAVVDELDTVAANCEVVKGGKAASTPAPTPTPAPTTSPRAETAPTPSVTPEKPVVPEKEKEKEPEKPEEPEEEAEEEKTPEPIPVYEERPLAMFPAGNGWTGNGVGTFEEAGPPFVVNNDRSYKIETDGTGDASIATSPQLTPVDLTAAHVAVQGLVSFSNFLGEVRLRLSSGDIETDYAEATVWDEGRDPTVLGTTFETQSIPTGGFAVHGTVDWSKIDRAQLIVTDNGNGNVFFYAAGIYAVPTYRTPTVSFAFDDSLESTFTLGVKKLTAYRMPATEYVIANAIDQPGFLTEEQLYTMRNLDHWEIGGHAATLEDHNEPNGLDSLTPEELKADFETMREWMFEHGFAQRTFAYPKGAAGQEVRKYAQRDYCAARVTAAGPETIPPRNPFTIRGFSINSSETHLAQLEEEVDKAIAEKSWLVLTFHNLVTGAPAETTDFNYTEFSELVDYVHAREAEGALQVRTVADAVGC
jgi:peptidoglycan/xylan/chitin deacetylase (PgdA/CDA1 family)